MNEFYFDLQRFDAPIVTTENPATFNTTGENEFIINGTSYKLTLAANSSATISTDSDNSVILTVTSGTVSNLIYSSGTTDSNIPAVNLLAGGGTFQAYKSQKITLGEQKVSCYFNADTGLSKGTNTLKVTSSKDNSIQVTVNATGDNNGTTFKFGDFSYNLLSKPISDLSLNVYSSDYYSLSVSANDTLTIVCPYDNFNKTLNPATGSFTLGKNATGLYVSSLSKDDKFVTYDMSDGKEVNKVTYKMGTKVLSAKNSSEAVKLYPGDASQLEIQLSDLEFDTSTKLSPALVIKNNTLDITNAIITANFTDNVGSLAVVAKDSDDDYSYAYGALKKVSENSFLVSQESTDNKYTAINIESGYTVEFSSTITDATITVADTTAFSVTDTEDNYSLTSGTGSISVGGATGLSLTKGTLLTSTEAQTIAAGDYSIYGYNDSGDTKNGITIGLSNSSVIVGDLDTGESLTAYDTTASATSNYTMLGAGLLKETNSTYTIYRDISSGGSHTLGSAGDLVIAPDSNKILEIGTTNTQSGVVFDNASNPTSLYAELDKSGDGYFLKTVSSATGLASWANTISLTGSEQTSISYGLASAVTNGLIIATNNSGKTTFKVTASADTFVVNSGTAEAPTITGATAITLLGGSITATKDQTITLDGLDKTFAVTNSTSGVKVSFDTSNNTATINASKNDSFKIGSDTFTVGSDNNNMTIEVTASGMTIKAHKGDSFTVGGENYTVDDGDGITFAVDNTTGKVTKISDLATQGDTFTRGNTGYSVKGAGFVTGTSPSSSIWNADNSHSLSGGSVAVDSLTVASNWLGVVTIDGSVTVPAGTNAGLLTDSAFDYTYGELKYGSNSATLTHGSNDSGTLKSINIDSGSTQYTLTAVGKNFHNVSITAPNSSIMVGNSTNGSYQVTLDGAGGNTGLVGATSASLISGKLTATSILTGGVVVDKATVIPGESVTLTTGAYGASISGLSYGEKFKVNNDDYVFTGAGLRNGDQLKRGTKTNSSVASNTLALASITSKDDWLGMRGVSSISGVAIGDNRNISDVFLVDDYTNDTQPSKLYGELKTVSGGYSLSTVTNFDKWEDNYTITVDTATVSISSGFEGANIKASQVGAAFKVDSLNDGATEFVVTDTTAKTGVTLSGAKAITQTDGLIAVAKSNIQSVTVGEHTIANSGNLSLDVSASGGTEATLSSLDEGENFNINSTGYSIISGLGLRTDNQFFKESSLTSSFKSATLSELTNLTDTNEWIYIAAIKNNILTVPPTINSSANEWLVLDENKTTRYGTLTSVTGGGLSLTKSTLDTTWGNDTIQVIDNTLSLSSDFSGKTIRGKSSGALFTVSDNSSYSVIDATGGASIGNATDISLSAGTISLSSANQTISGGDSVISGNDKDIKVTVTGGKATIGALATDDSFKVEGVTYTLLSNGRLQRDSDKSIWNGSSIKPDDSGSIAVASLGSNNWNGAISTDSTGNLTLDSAAKDVLATVSSAFIVNGNTPTSIYGSFTKDSDTYKLSTSGINTGATLPSVTITEDVGKVNFTKDLVNVSITAGSTTFTATKASSGYTVNYSSSELSVDDATAIDLTTGTLAIKNPNQLVTANSQSVQAVSEAVNVTYDNNGVTVDGITTAGESVKINNNTYTLATDTTGDGISVNINNGTTTIKDITVGDKFVIDNETFLYTSAGLTKTEANSDKISYVLKAVHPTSGELTLDKLQSVDEDTWLGIYLADKGNVTISSDITHSVVLVDSVTNPTTNYGQVKLSNGTYTLQKYSDNDEALKAIADSIENPTSITVEKGITAVIDSVFSSSTTSIPVKANNATSITVTDSSGNSYVIGGTVDKFIPSTMTFTPAVNDEFTIDGTTYLMTVAGLTKGNKIWTKANVTDYVLPDDDAWSAIVKLTTDNILDITKIAPEEGSNIVVDNSSSTRWATLDYTAATDTAPATYNLKYIDSDKLAAVQLVDGTANFTVNYETTITTGNGTYTINDNDYTGSGLVVATTASTSTLQDGTVTLDSTTQAVTPTNDSAISVTSGEITATASNGKWDTVNNLIEGDIFKIGDNTYKVYGSNTLAKVNSSGEPEEIYNSYITNGKLDYSKIVGNDYSAVIQLNSDDQLDLIKKLSVTPAIVVGQKDGAIDPTVRVAQIDYSETDDAYTLSETTDGVISTLKGVLLGTAVKSFNTDLETTVITSGTDTFTVNGKVFAALNALTITTASNDSAFLTNGKVTVAEGATVTARYTDTSNHDETITSTKGTLTVIADSTANTVTISDMDAGDVFNVGTNSYTMTSVGLTNGTKLNYNALKNNGITTAEFDLTDDAWKNIVPTESGVLTITNAVGSNVFVADVDTENPSSAVKYGTITKSSDDGIYTLTQADGNDTALEGIILTGVKVTFPTTCTNTNITAKDATFKVTASEPFTIDAASTTLSMSEEVTAVELVKGTLQATNGIPITANGNVITTTSGTMTVGIDDTGVFVGNLNENETFTVGSTSYKKTAAGLLDVTNQKLQASVTDTYYLGSNFDRIIQAPNGALDLSNEKQSAEVYDSISNPTTHMASLTVDDNGLTLKSVDGGVHTITLAKDAKLTVTFAATVNGSGTTIVNNVPYEGTNLVIDATATSSTLQSGTVTIDSGGSVKATKDSTALAVTSGSITATAADGRFTNIASLASGDIFTFNNKTYTQTAIGLISSDNKLNGDVSTDVTVANLSGTAWRDIHQATSGALTINSSTSSNAIVVEIADDKAQSKRYGTLTKSGDTYTLTQADNDSQIASITLDGVKASLPTTCADTTITANEATFTVTASEIFTVDATSNIPKLSNVTAITLTDGTIQALNNIPVTVGENVITTTSGTMTVGIDDTGIFVGNLNENETFTVDGTSYKKTAAGLIDVTNQKFSADVTDTYYIGTSFNRIIAADGSTLDLSNETQSAEVYDSISNPTTHMASLKVSGKKLTLNEVDGGISTITLAKDATLTVTFAATVNSSGNTTVNNVSYNGTDLVIDATATSSTLQSGTVTIDSGGSVKATKDSTALAVTDGSITATAASGRFTNIASLASGDVFNFNSKTYTQTVIGLVSSDNKLNEDVSTDVTVTDLSGTAWQDIHQATNGALTINSSTGSDFLVVDITNDKAQSKRYGNLTKAGGTYTLAQADTDSQLASITLDGVKASLPTTCANTTITANTATFTVTASELFTVDATSGIPVLSKVTAINLTDGTIQALNNIPITIGDNVITTTSGTMTVGIDSTGVFVGGLNENETFTVDGTSYKKTAAGLLDINNQKLRAAVTDTYYLGTSFDRIIEAPSGSLDLSTETQSAEVYDSISNPATHMATLTVSGGKLTLNEVDGGISTITLAKDATLTVDFAATVNSSGNTTVNSVFYNGTDLVIDATATSSTLQSGTVTIDSGGSVKATKDSTALAVTDGSITATAASGRFTNIASLASGDVFNFNSKTYTQTAIGLVSSDNKINEDVSTEITVANLSGTAWQDIHQATSGALTINTSTGSDVLVVDITDDKAQCKRYGTLTKSGVTYTLAQKDTDSQLASITLDGVKASLPTTCANTTITANAATFTVTASELFTVDATSDIPTLSNVTAITLNSGTIQALNNVPITIGDNVITTTSGTMTVGVDSTGVFVGGLNEDETFTVDGTSYKMTAAGLMDVTNQKLRAVVTDTYYLGSNFDRIISSDGSSLDLSNETTSAEVYDSITAPTTHMATLKISGGKLTLSEVGGGIDTIILAEDTNLTVDFAATVNASGTTTVNSSTYAGTTDLVIDATATSSTLQKGTVTINSGESVQATKDSTPLEVTSGSINAIATNGKFTTLNNVDAGDQFSFNDNSYIQSTIGLIKDSTISAELATSTINISNLDSAKWLDFIAPSGGVLNLTNANVNALVLDSATAPTTKLADLTISNSRFNLKGADNPTDIEAVTLPENSNINVDFATQVYAPEGSVTVNSTTFDAASEVIIDFDGSTATLYEGTVNLDTTKPTVKATNDSSALKVLRGSLTATVFDGLLVSLGKLDTKDSFSFNDTTYTKTELGLMKDDLISENLAGSTIELADIDTATWNNIIVPLNQTIDLTSATNALVCDDATNPTVKFATFTNSDGVLTLTDDGDAAEHIKTVDIAAGTILTVDFVTQVNASIGSVIVNSKSYNGTSELVIQSDGSTSTLTSGTVTLNTGDSVATTNGNNISISDGDGLTVTVGNNVTIDGMNIGDAFKVDDNSYKVTESGLINTSGKFWTGSDFTDGLTVDALNLATNWTGIVVAKDGVLSVGNSTLTNDETSTVVDDLSNPTITYGTLTKTNDVYTLTKNADNILSGIKIDNVKIDIDNNLAGVPLTITTPDGIKTSLNVTASAKFSNFTVDATGNNPTVNDVNAIEISAGKIELLDGQNISLAEDAQEVAIFAGNGTFNVGNETFTIAELEDNTLVEFDFDTDGNANSVIGFNKDSTVTIDGTTYTAPENNAILHYTEEDNWYFDGFAYDDYTVTVDTNGNVLVMPGVKFSNVISSGKTLSDDGKIKFAADYNKTPVTIVNQGKVALNINDANDNTLAENLSKHKNVTFNADGVETEDLTAVAGATFKLQDTKSLTAGDTKVTANDNDCEIGIGEDGTSISADKDATITAPADIVLTLNEGDYNVNGADFKGSGTTTATTTADGVKLDLANSDALTYDSMALSSAGTATIDNADGVTLSGGAKVANATNRALTVDGTAYLDDKIINTAKATEVTTTSAGVKVNRRNVKVSGDTDGYTVNIKNLDIIGLENIGNSDGVTVDGLNDATIKTDKAGSLTAGGKTFIYNNDSVIYGLDNGSIVSINDAEQIIGDFSDRVSVNGDGIRLTGSNEVTLSADKNGVKKLELSEEGTYRVNNKTYEIQDDGGFAFDMSGGAVTGVESVENGSLIISQDESGFGVNDGIVTLTSNTNPVTLGIVDSNIVSVSGVDGIINGLENATIYGLTNAVINNKPFKVSGSDEYTAIVADGVVNSIGGITDGATISSAPNVIVTTAENGTFTFDTTEYKVNDTLDGSVDFTTDGNSHVIEINNFAGAVSGVLEGVQSLNGKDFSISGAGEVSVTSDGDNITGITGITDGTEINGDVADLHYVLPEGKVTVNGIAYELEGDDNGALFVSNDGRALTGLDKDATLSVGAAGNYTINGTRFTVDAGDAFTVNRDGAYVIDPKNPPISEKTEAADILARGEKSVYVRPTATGNQTVDLTGDNDLALIDSANANVSVQAGAGNDSVVVRHDAAVDVNLDENGSTLIIPTAGKVTLENYNGDNAKVQTFDYSDVSGAIKSNEIKFGDGVMTLGDAIVTYDTEATDTGSTTGKLINAHGKELAVGFTHQNGGLLDESTSNENYLMKGNYAENSSYTQKGGGSTILTGSGNDTILAGAGDYIDAGGGYNQIYLTDKKMRNSVPEGATIVMNEKAYDTVSNFAGGFSGNDDKILIKNLSELGFGYGAGDLVMSAGSGQITFDNLSGNDHYELKLTDGTNEYKAAVAKADSVMAVDDSNEAEIFYGNEQGISFSEYTGAVEVNLNENAGSLNGSAVQYYGLNKVTGGAGDTSLIGAANTPNTLTAGTGNGSIWSNSGRDLMVGNTDAGKSGKTTFFYMPGDGRDTITNFDFMSGTTDINADKIQLDDTSGVTDVFLNGNDVMIGINNGVDDYLRLVDAKGKSFRFNDDLIAKVDDNLEFDGFTNCYVGSGSPSTLTVGEGMGDVGIWLSDDSLEYHGIWYDGNFAILDASLSTGNNTLAGNESDNLIIGGAGSNSIWGGYASSNDTLIGGSGQNTFFFALENGHDVIQNAHDGDLISLEDIYLENIARADITSGGAVIELTDGSRLEVQSSAAIDYRLQDGTTYTADRTKGEWVQK